MKHNQKLNQMPAAQRLKIRAKAWRKFWKNIANQRMSENWREEEITQ